MIQQAESMALAATPSKSQIARKRKPNQKISNKKSNKKLKPMAKAKNPTQRMKKLYKKRAKEYNSDDEEEEEEEGETEEEDLSEEGSEGFDFDEDDDENEAKGGLGITKFSEGCKAFRTAFLKIIKKHVPNDPLGPILSAHKKLVAEKLLEEETENKAKKKAKKEKQLAGEKGHIKPDSFLDTKEKELIKIATKGVVKLFNAVNKSQSAQNGLISSRSKDAKELAKRRKQTFLSELKKSTSEASTSTSSKVAKDANKESDYEPGWAPLRDSYMLSNSKLKDWDKMPDSGVGGDQDTMHMDSSSDED